MDMNVPKVVAFKACFSVVGVVVRKRGINRYAVNGSSGINFMMKFCALEGQLSFGGKWRGGCGRERLWIGRCGQFFDMLFYVVNELGHLQLIEHRE